MNNAQGNKPKVDTKPPVKELTAEQKAAKEKVDSERKAKRIEENKTRFKTIAKRRGEGIAQQIRLLGNCANTAGYVYTEEQVNVLFSTIQSELDAVKLKFKSGGVKKEKATIEL
jgi:hypothetical protein